VSCTVNKNYIIKNILFDILTIIIKHFVRRSELCSIAPIAVVMLPEAQACSVGATFERKAGQNSQRTNILLLVINILL